jgi:heat shock protein HslJ
MRANRAAVLVAALLPLAACAGPPPGAPEPTSAGEEPAALHPVGGAGLVGPRWSLTAAALDAVNLSDFGITIAFDGADATGRSGVSDYRAGYTSTPEGALAFGAIAGTRMAGPADAMAAEAAYRAALATVTGYAVADGELDLFAGDQEILVYAAPEAPASAASATSAAAEVATCDEGALQRALSGLAGAGDATVDDLQCAGGWALVRATAPGRGVGQYLFRADGATWRARSARDACGTVAAAATAPAADVLVPAELWAPACTAG